MTRLLLQGRMQKIWCSLLLGFISYFSYASDVPLPGPLASEAAKAKPLEKKYLGLLYVNSTFVGLHQNASRYSAVLTTMSCNHPVKHYQNPDPTVPASEWALVQVGLHEGMIQREFLSEKQENCVQGEYPRFFRELNLDVAETYFWGRLSDQFIQGRSKVRQ